MSLRPDDRSGRDRDRSATRDRSRSRSAVRYDTAPVAPRAPDPPDAPGYGYPSRQAVPGAFDDEPEYEERTPSSKKSTERSNQQRPTAPGRTSTYPQVSSVPYPSDDRYDDRYDSKGYPSRGATDYDAPRFPAMPEDDLAYGDMTSSPNGSRQPSFTSMYPPDRPTQPNAPQMPGYPVEPDYPYHPEPPSNNSRSSSYRDEYARSSREDAYTTRSPVETREPDYLARSRDGAYPTRTNTDLRDARYGEQSRDSQREEVRRSFSYDSYGGRDANVVEFTPGRGQVDPKSSTSKSARLSVDTRGSGSLNAPRSPGLSARTDRLSVSGNRPDLSGPGDLPPPSPLLEAYHGTYQQISPMPLAIRPNDDDELDALEPLFPVVTRAAVNDRLAQDVEKKKKKSVKVDNYEEDAERIQKALSGSRVDLNTLSEVLPVLSHDQMTHVKREYKKKVQIQGRGINLPKHIKSKLSNLGKDNFAKAAYVTSLGRWESEGYWANFFYQSSKSRRELLIESLMGRTNREIVEIKDEFRDKRYSDNLVKCMEQELKMDKFRVAVLMALEGRRQEEQDVYPIEYRNRDVDTLHKALTAKGGESTMLEIIVRRSDGHLREVMRTYERVHKENFPRAALKKSSNLVGEIIAHILNGVINKPVRDALLLRHAIQDIASKNKAEELRYELLISRLVRLHWDKPHLSRVKREYYEKYKKHLQEDVEDATSGEFADFMWELCETPKKGGSS